MVMAMVAAGGGFAESDCQSKTFREVSLAHAELLLAHAFIMELNSTLGATYLIDTESLCHEFTAALHCSTRETPVLLYEATYMLRPPTPTT